MKSNSFYFDDENEAVPSPGETKVDQQDSDMFEHNKAQRIRTIKNNFILVIILNIVCIL
jgi:hypothetical protein